MAQMNMNAKTLKALKASIAHWRRLATGKASVTERPFSDDCALCKLFVEQAEIGFECVGCPVMAKTGLNKCQRSPWSTASTSYFLEGPLSCRFKDDAKKELAFLKSLLPKSTRKAAKTK